MKKHKGHTKSYIFTSSHKFNINVHKSIPDTYTPISTKLPCNLQTDGKNAKITPTYRLLAFLNYWLTLQK